MNKPFRGWAALMLCLAALWSCSVPALAQEEQEPIQELHIQTVQEFLDFAEDCRLDSYSQNLRVILEEDLDLTHTKFQGIPIFSGEFQGNNHTISGLAVTREGSEQGLFRYLTQTAWVRQLTVQGKIHPGGSREAVGGIAGSNAGRITMCRFDGEISGSSCIGGMAGINAVTGVIETCGTMGTVYGDHFTGGIAGKNYGTIRGCTNAAQVNVTAEQNQVELSDITVHTLAGTEAANTVTDIGGIAGFSSGVIRRCSNSAGVGYRHMGYNVGGIAGSQQGYLVDCTNMGEINGRKEVGGIAGQMEPVSKVEYTADTLQILQGQLVEASSLANQASANAHSNISNINGQLQQMQDQAEIAGQAIRGLIPSKENPHLADWDEILAAKNTLSSSVSSMHGSMNSITSATRNSAAALSGDLQAIAEQLSAIGQTVNNASANLGGQITDISDSDTKADQTGKIQGCFNYGAVQGDLNAGGIAGAIAWENDLDPEDDLQFSGDFSLNFKGEVRAVITDCQNRITLTAQKRNAGGIVGRMTLGLVKNCINTGSVVADDCEYVGGIAGASTGFIRSCSTKCELTATTYAGGIAGSAAVVSDCRSMVRITGSKEKMGAVLGSLESGPRQRENSLSGNYYLTVDQQLGGVDGISYAGQAEPLDSQSFFKLEDLPEIFSHTTVTFLIEDGTYQTLSVFPGEGINPEDIPPVPEKENYNGVWAHLSEMDLSHVYFNRLFEPMYTPYQVTVRSEAVRKENRPLLLAEGKFASLDYFDLTPLNQLPPVPEGQNPVEGWQIPAFSDQVPVRLRFALPDQTDAQSFRILVRDSSGKWNQRESSVSGSYGVFSVNPGEDAFCLLNVAADYGWAAYAAIGAGAGLVFAILLWSVKFRSKKKKQTVPPQPPEALPSDKTEQTPPQSQ